VASINSFGRFRNGSEDESEADMDTASTGDPLELWKAEFLSYIETIEAAPPASMNTIQRPKVSDFEIHELLCRSPTVVSNKINTQRYLVWATLARDHLSIMAALVSSE
jgi:hypothetical protein